MLCCVINMPEKEDKVVVEDETSPPSAKRICCDDPSEYRPEVKDMSLGKEQDDFRVFYKVYIYYIYIYSNLVL